MTWQKLGCVPNLYPGRAGIIYDLSVPDMADALASAVLRDSESWDAFSITVVANSNTELAILEAARAQAFAYRIVSELDIPFIAFPPTWDEYIASLPKKFRYTIRSGEKLLKKLGKLEMRLYTESEQCDEFLKLAYAIERKSWKEGTGTSLTRQPIQKRFHEQLAPVAAELGMFRGYVLLLDGEPIAHIYGLQFGDVLCDLKESFDKKYADSSPGSVLKGLVMQELIGGTIKSWDFIGRAEFHKLRWTNDVYKQRHYVFYAGGKGRLLRWRHDLGVIMRKLHILPAQEDSFGRAGSSGTANQVD